MSSEVDTGHAATILDDFLTGEMKAECSCGWSGDKVDQLRGPRAMRQHLALADWAAHVHVASGLATEDDS